MQKRKPNLRSVVLAAAAMALLAPIPAGAFGLTGVGGTLGYDHPEDMDGTASVRMHAELEQADTHLHLLPNIAYWDVDQVRDLNPNLDVYYHFRPDGRMTPYLGGGLGLNFVHRSRLDESSTDLGMNLIGGLRFPGTANHVFLEGRYTASDVNQVSLLTGITFHTR